MTDKFTDKPLNVISAKSINSTTILSSDIVRGPWPHEACGCHVPKSALPPHWTCFKCDTTWRYIEFEDRPAWIVGV